MDEPEVDLERLKETARLAEELLTEVRAASYGERGARIRPRPEDYAAVFLPEWVAAARAAYADCDWGIDPYPEQSRVLISGVIPAFMLATDNPASRQHKGGYRHVAHALRPQMHWVSWKFVEPGARFGMSYDGLVRVTDDRFAWFPQPWHILAVEE